MEISPQERDTVLKVLHQIANNSELIDRDESLKGLIAKIYKQGKKQQRKSARKSQQSAPETHNRYCFICQQNFSQEHDFYAGVCCSCGNLNYVKRHQIVDLKNKIALVTGARIRIGYSVALKLLRSGATVIATTRFPHDAAKRYTGEKDFQQWQHRLHIYGLDLRHLESLAHFTQYISKYYSRLDIIINNAAQTVRYPPNYYRHLLNLETLPWQDLPKDIQGIVARHHEFYLTNNKLELPQKISDTTQQYLLPSLKRAVNFSALLSQIPLTAEDFNSNLAFFPERQSDGEQLDLRSFNSWLMKDEDVELVELLEVHIINAIAPFIINSRLKSLMSHSKLDKYIINVSSREGSFHSNKSWRHPHTNMAKAALNQMTRTCAREYARHGIFMNAVDPGWISFQHPHNLARIMQEKGLNLPLDVVDGAARIYDPIFLGMTQQQYSFGKLFKNYQAIPW
jgi:NAD(P)-dependent dehydrogenase (short-subunit alcohol dehydrogenase family)